MSAPYLGEMRIMSFNFPPKGWAQCDGQLLPINQNQALFSLLGTIYGGDGQSTFALPDLRGRVPMHFGQSTGSNFTQGQSSGETAHTLTAPELAAHQHTMVSSRRRGTSSTPAGNLLGEAPAAGGSVYRDPPLTLDSLLNPGVVTSVGGSQAHTNLQPTLVLNVCIALQGIFPSRN